MKIAITEYCPQFGHSLQVGIPDVVVIKTEFFQAGEAADARQATAASSKVAVGKYLQNVYFLYR